MQTVKTSGPLPTLFDDPSSPPPPAAAAATKTKRKHQLPEGWAPTDAHVEKARELNVDLAREAEQFRLHAGATGRLMQNWDLAFHAWLNNAKPMPHAPATGGRIASISYSTGPMLPPAPRFDTVQPGQYDPNYLQPKTPEMIAAEEAQVRLARQQLIASRDRNRHQR